MAISKSAKIWAEMEKVKAKISEQQSRQKHREAENEEIVDIVRGMSVTLDELPALLRQFRGGPSGHGVQKPGEGKEET